MLESLLTTWRSDPNIAAWRTLPAQAAQTVALPDGLHPALTRMLHRQNIHTLYSHQAECWSQVANGRNPVVVTGTASGKTLCYNLPVLQALLTNPQARALYLFPTKALTNDQLTSLNNQLNLSHEQLPVASYDGDTPTANRPAIRQKARIVLTNPDMLHTGLLPHHTRWVEFFCNLRFVVIDEMHVYRGVFGSHVANLFRRLKRVTRFYQPLPAQASHASPPALQFILTSATIANPIELAERLIEEPVTLINHDGAAKGAKHFIIYNPPIINPELGLRRGLLQECVRLSQTLLEHGSQTIIFARTRRTVEMLLTYLRQTTPVNAAFPASSHGQPTSTTTSSPPAPVSSAIRAYRSGYLPAQRREIEAGLRDGSVQAVVATSALELGIDIGGMDAALLAGYPGTIAGTWQQAGRSGRQGETSLALLVVSANPLDQFLAQHPDYFFERSPEQALIDPDNLLILLQHLRCAAFELPFSAAETLGRVALQQMIEFLQFLQESGDLHRSGEKFFWMADRYPAEQVSLRSASANRVRLLAGEEEAWTTIGQVDIESAAWMVHPQAIYLHEGQSYVVDELDLEQGTARLHPIDVDYYTEPKRETSVQLIETVASQPVCGGTKTHGELLVTTQVVGYSIVQWFSHERLGDGTLDLPPHDLHTTGYWLALAADTVDTLRQLGLWSNDPNNYGANWPGQRNKARARDGYRCQICGLSEKDAGREHDVHHKIPFRTFASFRLANQLANLITLCRACHRRAETSVRMKSGLSGLASVLGHLAPLFLMCDQHDVGVHADPASPLAEGQPAVVIYDRVPAGIGFSQRLFSLHIELISHAHELVSHCGCMDGCPSCVGPAGEAGVGGKQETLALLAALR